MYSHEEIRQRSVSELEKGVRKCQSTTEFFELIGITRQKYYAWKNISKRGVSPQYVAALAKKLDLDPSELRIDIYPPNGQDPQVD